MPTIATLPVSVSLAIGDNQPITVGTANLPVNGVTRFTDAATVTVGVGSPLAGARHEIARLLRAAANEIEHPAGDVEHDHDEP